MHGMISSDDHATISKEMTRPSPPYERLKRNMLKNASSKLRSQDVLIRPHVMLPVLLLLLMGGVPQPSHGFASCSSSRSGTCKTSHSRHARTFMSSQMSEDEGSTDNEEPKSGRRDFINQIGSLTAATAAQSVLGPSIASASAASASSAIATPKYATDVSWPLGKVAFSLLPLAGTSTRRATVEETIIPNQIWTHDQIQGVVNVNVPVRQTVVKLSPDAGGGLLVYNPVAPTPQLLKMMKALEKEHGPVRHIVLGTVALEHKATFGPFAQRFPNATVWLQPGQWAFPIGLPIEFLGVTQRGKRLREIPTDNVSTGYKYWAERDPVPEWAVDFDVETLGPFKFKSVGAFSETAMFHKPSKTLLVTDSVVSVTDEPPAIIQEDPRAMLFHARDSIEEIVQDTEETRKKGWRRMVQFGLVFFPSQIDVVSFGKAISQASKIDKSMKPLGEGAVPGSLYPWTWHDNDADLNNFKAISKGGALFCPPILTKLILDREPKGTLEWVERVTKRFDFQRVIPCHLNNNIKAGPKEFYDAFDPLRSDPKTGNIKQQRALAEDLALLQKASDILTDFGVVDVSQVCDGEPARTVGRFASR